MAVIAILFEYSTLNGGERSMLAMLDWFRQYYSFISFVGIGPKAGRLGEALQQRQITIINWSPFDDSGKRFPNDHVEQSLCSIVEQLSPDLLHANSLAMGRLIGRLKPRLRTQTSCHLRDIIKLSKVSIAELNCNDRLIAVSHATRDFHVAQGLDKNRVTVVHNGVNLQEFQPRPKTGRLTTELNLPDAILEHGSDCEPKFVATIGQIGLRKGLDTLAAAALQIVIQVPETQFLIIGERMSQKDESVEFEQSIYREFETVGMSDRLHMLGYRDDIASLLNEVDVLVHPANQEPLGRVLLEASVSGVPIVATDVGGTREIIDDRVTGYLFPARDHQSLTNLVVKILTDDHEATRIGRAARARAESKFAIATAAQNLFIIWNELLNDDISHKDFP